MELQNLIEGAANQVLPGAGTVIHSIRQQQQEPGSTGAGTAQGATTTTTEAVPAPAPTPEAPPLVGGGTALIVVTSVTIISELIGMSPARDNSIVEVILRGVRALVREYTGQNVKVPPPTGGRDFT